MGQRVARRPEADDQHVLAVVRQRIRPLARSADSSASAGRRSRRPTAVEHVGEHAVSICGMLTGSCFWKMQAFMQSLQMRWPVPGHIGLSIMTSASAPIGSPRLGSRCISEIFSSSGQPGTGCRAGSASTVPSCRAARRARILVALVAEHAVVDLAEDLARVARASVSLNPSRRRRRSSGPSIASGRSARGRCTCTRLK